MTHAGSRRSGCRGWRSSAGRRPAARRMRPTALRVALVVEAAHGQLVHAATTRGGGAARHPADRCARARPRAAGGRGRRRRATAICWRGWRAGHRAGRRWSRSTARMACGMDVAGVAHLFGGEARPGARHRGALCGDGAERAGGAGRDRRARRGGWRGSAAQMALPRAGEALADRIAPLPVAALRLGPGPTRTLELLGLKTIGAARRGAAAQPGAALSRGRQSVGRARPDAGAQGRAADRGAVRGAAARDDPAGRAGRRPERGGARRSIC